MPSKNWRNRHAQITFRGQSKYACKLLLQVKVVNCRQVEAEVLTEH